MKHKINQLIGIALLFSVGLFFIGCKGPSGSEAEVTDKELDVNNSLNRAAFSVLRALSDLTIYDPDAEKDDDTGEVVGGIETLPDNWESLEFICDQGYEIDSEKPTVRYYAANGVDDAKDFFSSIIGEVVTNNSYTWNCVGLGTISFRVVENDDDLFAIMDVDIDVMPNLTQLRFVPAEIITAALASENKYSGIPYYSAGDIIRRKNDETYWLCVRPSGGPMEKDTSYWICLNPFTDDEPLVKKEKKSVTVAYSGEQKQSQNWYYAKNLMQFKTAKAAYHTLNSIVYSEARDVAGTKTGTKYLDSIYRYELRSPIVIDLMNLSRSYKGPSVDNDQQLDEYKERYGYFCFAYDGVTKDKARKNSGKSKNAFYNYVQPFINCESSISNGRIREDIFTKYTGSDFLLSLTDSYDEDFIKTINANVEADKNGYNFADYLAKFYTKSGDTKLYFIDYSKTYLNKYHVIVSPELVIKDNKGTNKQSKKPSSSYEDYFHQPNQSNWYWKSLDSTDRYIDNVKVDWNLENKE